MADKARQIKDSSILSTNDGPYTAYVSYIEDGVLKGVQQGFQTFDEASAWMADIGSGAIDPDEAQKVKPQEPTIPGVNQQDTDDTVPGADQKTDSNDQPAPSQTETNMNSDGADSNRPNGASSGTTEVAPNTSTENPPAANTDDGTDNKS